MSLEVSIDCWVAGLIASEEMYPAGVPEPLPVRPRWKSIWPKNDFGNQFKLPTNWTPQHKEEVVEEPISQPPKMIVTHKRSQQFAEARKKAKEELFKT